MHEIPPFALNALIQLGSAAGGAVREVGALNGYDWLNRTGATPWVAIAARLSDDDLIALTRGLVIMGEQRSWFGGSVASAIHTFQILVDRSPDHEARVADWILQNSANPWLPYGFQNLGAKSYSEYCELRVARSVAIDREIARTAHDEAQARVFRELRMTQRRRAAEERRTIARTQLISELNAKPLADQLWILIVDSRYPPEFFPTRLAVALQPAVLGELDSAMLIQLFSKLRGRRRGPWATLKRRVREILAGRDPRGCLPWDRQPWALG